MGITKTATVSLLAFLMIVVAHAARADLCRRLGRAEEARAPYERALSLAQQEPERRFLKRRLTQLPS